MNGMSNISNGVLQGIGKANIPMINAAIALVVDVVVVTVLMFVTDFGIYNVVLAMIVYALVMCILNDRALKKNCITKIRGKLHIYLLFLQLFLWELQHL